MGASVHKQTYHYYLKTDAWKRKRAEVLGRDGNKCQGCSSTDSLHVHHVTYERIFDELPEDLVTLCKSCHEKAHQSCASDPPDSLATLEAFRDGKSWRLDDDLCSAAPVTGNYYCDRFTWMLGFAVYDDGERSWWLHWGKDDGRRHHRLGLWPELDLSSARQAMLRAVADIGWQDEWAPIRVPVSDACDFFGVDESELTFWRRSGLIEMPTYGATVLLDERTVPSRGPLDLPQRCCSLNGKGLHCPSPAAEASAFCRSHKWKGCKAKLDNLLVCCRTPVDGIDYCKVHVVDRLRELEAWHEEASR
jgi:hypothetical protein